MSDTETPRPLVDIFIGKSAAESRVTINGQDVTQHLQGVRVECVGGTLPIVTLTVRPGHSRTTVEGAIDVSIEETAP